jgi:uncharacterized cupin superfamily protein
MELLVVEVPGLLFAVLAAAEPPSPDALHLRMRHSETYAAEASGGDEHAVLRQQQAERKGQQGHVPTIENPGVDVSNLFAEQQDWEGEQERDGYRHRVRRIGAPLGAELLGASLYELPPGESTWPYHFERASEEWLLVVAGRPTLRTPEGERRLEPGDVAVFPHGETGAHKVTNATDEAARVVIFSSKSALEVVTYPDSGKVGIWTRDDGYIAMLHDEPKLDYWEGE